MSERKVTTIDIRSDGVYVNGEKVKDGERYRRMMAQEQHFRNRAEEYPTATKEEIKWLGSTVFRRRV